MENFRWGILGGAGIARKNWESIRLSGNGVLRAVASREMARAESFIADCQAEAPFDTKPEAVAGYDVLLARDDIDGVYIPLPTAIRGEWVRKAAAAGKHVLCEKPCAVDAGELNGLLDACLAARVQFMDGVMFQHSVRLESMGRLLGGQGGIGAVRRVASAFAFTSPPGFGDQNIRGSAALEPLGALGDLGWYCARITLWAFDWRTPTEVRARVHRWTGRSGEERQVPSEMSVEMGFEGGGSASFFCSFHTAHQQWAHITGSEGCLWVPDFVLPFHGRPARFDLVRSQFEADGVEVRMRPEWSTLELAEPPYRHRDAQEVRMFRAFVGQVRSGTLNSDWPRMALQTQEVMDACMRSVG